MSSPTPMTPETAGIRVPSLTDEQLERADDRWLRVEIARIEAALSRYARSTITELEPGSEVVSAPIVVPCCQGHADVTVDGGAYSFTGHVALHAPYVEEGVGFQLVVWFGSGEHSDLRTDELRPIYRALPTLVKRVLAWPTAGNPFAPGRVAGFIETFRDLRQFFSREELRALRELVDGELQAR